jgi:AcrR family transcriptional regulator
LAQRPKRADGRRNYDAILAAARAAFDARGADAFLEDIAKDAGVAIGTLYGHFPTRETLIEAAVREGLETMSAHSVTLADADDPLAALTTWLHEAIDHCSTFRGLVGFLAASSYDEGTPLYHACVQMHDAGSRLVRAAQQSGQVRADLTGDELFTIITSVAWARETSPPGHDASTRLLRFLLDGITVKPVPGR